MREGERHVCVNLPQHGVTGQGIELVLVSPYIAATELGVMGERKRRRVQGITLIFQPVNWE
jgi:hypothetical protein